MPAEPSLAAGTARTAGIAAAGVDIEGCGLSCSCLAVLLHRAGTVLQELLAWIAAKRFRHLLTLWVLQLGTVQKMELLGMVQMRGTPAEVHAAVVAVGTAGVAYRNHTGSKSPCLGKDCSCGSIQEILAVWMWLDVMCKETRSRGRSALAI